MTLFVALFRVLWRNRDSWLVFGILALSLTLNVYQTWNANRPPVAEAPLRGTKAPSLYAKTIQGAEVELDWASDGRPTLLYVFSPTCAWCKRNLDNMEALVSREKRDYNVVGLSLTSTGLTDYIRRANITYVVYADPDPAKSGVFMRGGTPSTFVIAVDGTITQAWRGAYAGKVKEQIEASFGVKLPGISQDLASH